MRDEDVEELVKRTYSDQLPGAYAVTPPAGTLDSYIVKANIMLDDALIGGDGLRVEGFGKSKLKRGDAVLSLCCGSGYDFGFIRERIGAEGHILGVDFSPLMLKTTRDIVDEQGWGNVELREADATAELAFDTKFDMACCVFGISVIPKWERAYRNLFESVKPGGEILIIDVRFADGWKSVFNPLFLRFTKRYAGTDRGLRNFMQIAERMQRDLSDVTTRLKKFSGFVRGTRPDG